MQAEKLAKYLTELKNKTGLSYEAISEMSNTPESTVKNLCNGKTGNPGIDTIAPVMYAMGGSFDEMLNPEKSKDEIKETSVIAIKEGYEHQMQLLKEAYDEQIANIRTQYEQHHNDLKENFERRLADKREMIDTYLLQIKALSGANKTKTILCCILSSIFIVLFVMEILHQQN